MLMGLVLDCVERQGKLLIQDLRGFGGPSGRRGAARSEPDSLSLPARSGPREALQMDVHKPKAARSIREFLIEIGTITVGILIALALEAAVEGLRNHDLVEHARTDLKYELTANRAALQTTVSQEKVASVALDVLAHYGDDRLAGKPARLPPDVTLGVSFKPMNTAAWESTQATQALVHMPYSEAQALARAYAGSGIFNSFEADAIRHWYELAAVPDPASLSDADLKAAMHEIRLNQTYTASIVQSGSGLIELYDKALAQLK
jgi:hypothetical protein